MNSKAGSNVLLVYPHIHVQAIICIGARETKLTRKLMGDINHVKEKKIVVTSRPWVSLLQVNNQFRSWIDLAQYGQGVVFVIAIINLRGNGQGEGGGVKLSRNVVYIIHFQEGQIWHKNCIIKRISLCSCCHGMRMNRIIYFNILFCML